MFLTDGLVSISVSILRVASSLGFDSIEAAVRLIIMECASLPALFLVALLALAQVPASSGTSIGVNYGRLGDNLPSPQQVVALLNSNNITKVRIFDADATVIRAFSNSSIDLGIAVPNEQLQSVSASTASAKSWVDSNVIPYVPSVRISSVSVGNEVLTNNQQYSQFLLPAMKNIYSALKGYGLHNATKVSTPHAFNVLSSSSFPPSSGTFNSSSSMQPILDFLSSSDSPFMINVYPFFSYTGDPTNVPLDYALFGTAAQGVTDAKSNAHYSNLYDAMVDTVVSAMGALNYGSLPIVVTETGWPSKGDETGATMENASKYNNNLISHLQNASGTPLRPGVTVDTYIFALFNEDQKTGPTSERNFGLFQPNQAQVYNIRLST